MMWARVGCAAGLAVCVLFTPLQTLAEPAEDVTVLEVVGGHAFGEGLERADVIYPLAVLDGAGWRWTLVEKAIRQVEEIFDQCGVTVTAGPVYRLAAPESYRELDESMQARLLEELPASRPAVLLVDRTTDRDVAYSYLASAPVASRGTAWVTRNSQPACLGVLLAHELGHILLNSARHSNDPDNLMSHSCTFSNIRGSGIGAGLSEAQCQQLRER